MTAVIFRPRSLVLVLLFAGCSGGKTAMRATPPDDPYTITMRADQTAGFLIIPAVVDGGAATFIFDTGAGTTVLDKAAFTRLDLPKRGRVETRDSGGHVDRLPITLIGELGLGDARFEKVGAIVSDLSFIEHHICRRVDGILGANVLQHGVLQVDYETGTILLASAVDRLPTPKGTGLRATLLPTPLPVIPVDAGGGARFGLIVDTGSNGDLAVDAATVDALEVELRVPAIGTTSAGLLGLGGHDEAFAWPNVPIGELQLAGADASTAPLSTLGNLILRSFTVRIDYEEHFATFWPNARPIPTGHVTFGFAWDYDEHGRARVVFVRERSAAFAAGIAEGNVVERVGDSEIAALDRDGLCRLRRDWAMRDDPVEVVINGKTHCLRKQSLFEEPEAAPQQDGECSE